MLKKIIIENYRCFKKYEINFKDLTIIVGKNNAGKSTLIECLRLISLITSRYKSLIYSRVPRGYEIPISYNGVSVSLKGIDFSFENLFNQYGSPPAMIKAVFSNNASIELYIGKEEKLHAVLFDGRKKPIQTKAQARAVNFSSINILGQISPLSNNEKSLEEDYVRANLSSSLSSLHFRNQLQYLPEYFEIFKNLSESTWDGLKIDGFENGSKIHDQKPALLVQDENFVAEIGWMGHGLQLWLQTMWFLSRVDTSSTVILDEPDVYMHADLQRKLIRFLKDRYKQVIVATHSIEIMAEVEPGNILILDRHKEKSDYATSLPAVQNVINKIGSLQNIELARLWSASKFLLVEGKDISILKRIQDILFKKSNDPFDAIPNMQIGGWGGWNLAIGSKMLLKNAVDSDIITYCIFDSDYHTEMEIQERYKKAVETKVSLHIWEKKEIENYLLVPTAISRIIEKNTTVERTINPDIVSKKIIEIIDDLVDNAIDSIATEIQNRNRKLSAGTAHKEARKYLKDNWENRKDIISGKVAISKLSEWSKKFYNVSMNSTMIASELRAEEIDEEMKIVITKIEKCEDF